MQVRPHTKVSQHLDRLCILNVYMALLHHRLHKVLVNQLTHRAPERAVLHHKQMRAACNGMRNERLRPVAVFGALAVNDLLDETGVGDDDRCPGAQFE